MEVTPLDRDIVRFRWIALGVIVGSLVAMVSYVALHGWSAFGQLAVAGTAVFLSKLAIFGGNLQGLALQPVGTRADRVGDRPVGVSCALLAGLASFERLPLAGKALADVTCAQARPCMSIPACAGSRSGASRCSCSCRFRAPAPSLARSSHEWWD